MIASLPATKFKLEDKKILNLCYRGVQYNPQSTSSMSSASSHFFKYRGVSYYHQSLNLAK
ncbi:hypothetical protein M595_3254 [Lyngbya aestuarii BL J]|uniref:DUF4278 domain-containing protein n=1 Tax=Lyngbya aestuarii BL J TaxID=1348334 RepID=U7QHS5_9CYAN|nr:hypothetical protein M595_3254 [Lyngbya aestuarii BL J]